MSVGIGGVSVDAALSELAPMTAGLPSISESDFRGRLDRLQGKLREAGGGVAYLHAGTNLHYFTGLQWNPE